MDTSFNSVGYVTTQITTGDDEANAIAIQSDGKILVVGDVTPGGLQYNFAVVRYLGSPPASTAILGGRITGVNGQGIRGVLVTITGGGLPEPRVALTSLFGFYSFYDVPTGQTYTLTPSAKLYEFTPPSRLVSLPGDFSEANFTGQIP